MTNDTINDIINDAYDLAKGAATTPSIGIKSIARRLEQLVKDGFYVTPEAARKFAEDQAKKDATPIDPSGPTLNQILMNPPLTGFAKLLAIPALGMQFRRYTSANTTILVATWRDDVNSHVYVLRVERDGDSPNCGWRATATNDGHVVFQLRTKSRSNCEQFAFSAMKRYLKRGHRRTYRTIAKAKEEK